MLELPNSRTLTLPRVWPAYAFPTVSFMLSLLYIFNVGGIRDLYRYAIIATNITGYLVWMSLIYSLHQYLREISRSSFPTSPRAAALWHLVPIANVAWVFIWTNRVAKLAGFRSYWTGAIILLGLLLTNIDPAIGLAVLLTALWLIVRRVRRAFQRSHTPVATEPVNPATLDEFRRSQPRDRQVEQWLGLLRDGVPEEKARARLGLSYVFEERGMLCEAIELLEANIEADFGGRDAFARLASLYRRAGRVDLADNTIGRAARLSLGDYTLQAEPSQTPDDRRQGPWPMKQEGGRRRTPAADQSGSRLNVAIVVSILGVLLSICGSVALIVAFTLSGHVLQKMNPTVHITKPQNSAQPAQATQAAGVAGSSPDSDLRCAQKDKVDITAYSESTVERKAALTLFNTCNRAIEGTVQFRFTDPRTRQEYRRVTFYLANIQPGRQYRIEGKVDNFDERHPTWPSDEHRIVDIRAVAD